KMLGLLLEAGKPAPEALAILAEEDYLGWAVQRRLDLILDGVRQGQSLTGELLRCGLLPARMVPFLNSAAKARNFPWALQESGDHLVRQAAFLVRRIANIFGPVAILLLGLFSAFISLALF